MGRPTDASSEEQRPSPNAGIAEHRPDPSPSLEELQRQVAVVNSELKEALDREAATAELLNWDHLRTSNPIESVFATVRHRTVRTKGALSAKTAKLMVFKLVNADAKTWRRLNGENQLPKVVQGIKFKNGIEVTEMPAHHAA